MLTILILACLGQGTAVEEWAPPPKPAAPVQPPRGEALTQPPLPASDARSRYLEASALIGSGQYGQAIAVLNELSQSAPSAEVFAARCSALLGAGSSAAALADCQYALRLKPAAAIPSALYGQALAEERIGATRAAITHFRDFAALSAPPEQRNEALRRAGALEASLAPPPAPPAPRQPSPGPAVRVVVAPPGSSQRGCGNHLDCGHGGWCKDRGDGLKVCMDSGEHGDACQSSIDCGSGGFCRDRGDGMKVCMSHGGAGAPCSTSIDCGGGLFCRGGTIKTCQ